MKDLDISWHTNTAGHPQGRGVIERFHSTLGEHLRIYHEDAGLSPEEAMPKAVMAYNHSIHSSTGFSPFEMLFGLRVNRRDTVGTAVDKSIMAVLVNNRTEKGKMWATARARVMKEKRNRVARGNVGLRDRFGDLRIGSIVYRRRSTNRGKESGRYEGPFKVIVIREHNLVTIQSLCDSQKRLTVHIEQLKIPGGI